jgi:hypothetical protein
VLNDLLLSTGVPRVHVGQRANATVCGATLTAAQDAVAELRSTGYAPAFCAAMRSLGGDRCLCAGPALFPDRNQTALAAQLASLQVRAPPYQSTRIVTQS